MDLPSVVSPREWEEARERLLVREKELTHARDALAAERRRMPRMLVEREYRFEGPDGPVGLADLFEGRRQLIVYRFFFEPGVEGWPDEALGGLWAYLDITPLGRQEDWEDSPAGYPQGPANSWVTRHDEYDTSELRGT